MLRLFSISVVALTLAAAEVARGQVTVGVNPPSGGIRISNSSGQTLFALTVTSASKSLVTDPTAYAILPGATFLLDVVAGEFTYLNYPPSPPFAICSADLIGRVLKPGAPASDITVSYSVTQADFEHGQTFDISGCPEPASFVLAGAGLLGFIAARRRYISRARIA